MLGLFLAIESVIWIISIKTHWLLYSVIKAWRTEACVNPETIISCCMTSIFLGGTELRIQPEPFRERVHASALAKKDSCVPAEQSSRQLRCSLECKDRPLSAFGSNSREDVPNVNFHLFLAWFGVLTSTRLRLKRRKALIKIFSRLVLMLTGLKWRALIHALETLRPMSCYKMNLAIEEQSLASATSLISEYPTDLFEVYEIPNATCVSESF